MPTPGLLLVVAGLVLVALSVRVVPEQERLAIFRLGRYAGLRGPGLVCVLPVLDKATRISLDRDVPNWRSLTSEQLAEEIGRRLTGPGLGG